MSPWLPEPVPMELRGETKRTGGTLDYLVETANTVKFLREFGQINQDVLGAYSFRLGFIHLYWMAIGFFAGVLNVPAEALTVVVATHELAHAYSHLGKDTDSERWDTAAFGNADPSVREGLAQYYTHVVCQKLKGRYPTASDAFQRLLAHQSGPYVVHKEWMKDSKNNGEVVRTAMISYRAHSETDYDAFKKLLESHARTLKPSRSHTVLFDER